MNKNIVKVALGLMLGASVSLTSCFDMEPDESNLYTFTGKTIQDYLTENDSVFSQFNVIMKRSGYDRMMASYGQYTCYAPINSGVEKYVDSLYNDPEAKEPNNGMTENSVMGLTVEQCKEIAQYHLSAMMNSYIEELSNYSGKEISTMMNTPFISKLGDDGVVRFNGVAEVTSYDNEMINGYVHVITEVIPRTTRRVAEVLEKNPQFKLFFEAVEKCGLLDTLAVDKKLKADGTPRTYSTKDRTGRPSSSFTALYHVPTECKIKFTIFAEDSAAFAKENIFTFDDLKAKCVEWYGGAAAWYDYPGKAENPISTGDDYENPFNVVNMFVRYHIVKAGMAMSKLVYEKNNANENWNYAFGGEPHDYYETMLPHALMKIWQPLYQPTGASTNIWINRWRQNNTLTDEIGTVGSDATHQILQDGCMVVRNKSNIASYN
ncbi:MAG: fasciclin domain-containing protein, partial [Bacteroidaceae bacterium]|nr:fasciclin domain-containing protein [Bacteroidaceae bacterium]